MSWFSNLGIRAKVLVTVGIACLICGSISVGVAIHFNDQAFKDGLVNKARTLHGRLDVASKYVANQGGLAPMAKSYIEKYKSPDELTPNDKLTILQQVPIYAAMKIGSEDSEKQHYKFRVFSDEPRNLDNTSTPKEAKIFSQFKDDPSLKEIVEDTGEEMVVYKPVRLKESYGCLSCHGHPSTSPWENGKDILGYPMENWKDGKLHGVFAISSNYEDVKVAAILAGHSSPTGKLILFILLGAALALAMAAFIIRGPVGTLRRLASLLSETGAEVAGSSGMIASSSKELSSSATIQAAALEETASSIEEMSAMVTRNAENAKGTASNSLKSQQAAKGGQGIVQEMLESMAEIDQSNEQIIEQVNDSNQQMSEIVKVIEEISEKTKVINDIVFQTKLLSFNASVEAARAGEYGKGFAVVAEEVGNLAQMSGTAAKEISEMLDQSTSKVEAIVRDTKVKVDSLVGQGKEKVQSGISVANKCREALEEIVENVSSVSAMADEISSASQEQSQGISEISRAMSQIEESTQRNSATSNQSSSAASSLSEQAVSMQDAVLELLTTVNGLNSTNGNTSLPPKVKRQEGHKENVVNFREKTPSTGERKVVAKASGDDLVPDSDDPGFREI